MNPVRLWRFLLLVTVTGCLFVSCDDAGITASGKSTLVEDSGWIPGPGEAGDTTVPWNASVRYGRLDHGGRSYRTVRIGTATWMAENLNLPVDSSWCPANDVDSCTKYGRLYQWSAAMALESGTTSPGVSTSRKGICPTGWHLPSDQDWYALEDALGSLSNAGFLLKSSSGWLGTETDEFGFRAMPAGYRNRSGQFDELGKFAHFWSSTEQDGNTAWNRYLGYNFDRIARYNSDKKHAHSVRCIKDAS